VVQQESELAVGRFVRCVSWCGVGQATLTMQITDPRVRDIRFGTATSSRGSVHPPCSGLLSLILVVGICLSKKTGVKQVSKSSPLGHNEGRSQVQSPCQYAPYDVAPPRKAAPSKINCRQWNSGKITRKFVSTTSSNEAAQLIFLSGVQYEVSFSRFICDSPKRLRISYSRHHTILELPRTTVAAVSWMRLVSACSFAG